MPLRSNTKKDLTLFILGAILGPICDGFHTFSNTLYYPHVLFLKMAWWVPLLFGFAAVSVGNGHLIADKLFNRKRSYPQTPNIIFALLLFIVLYFVSGFLAVDTWMMFLILGVGSIGSWALFDSSSFGLVMAAIVAVIGTAVEITLSSFDLFYYNHPDIFGVPLWLPFLYVAASVAIGLLARKLALKESI